jgi:CheY-like chemotaxis protein
MDDRFCCNFSYVSFRSAQSPWHEKCFFDLCVSHRGDPREPTGQAVVSTDTVMLVLQWRLSASISFGQRRNFMMRTVLMVDDNASLAYFTARLLQRGIDGLEVITALSAAEARNVVDRCNPCVVISDIKLPDGNGVELVQELTRNNPDLSAILISGEVPAPANLNNLFGFLSKPYEADTLVDLVKKALAGQKPASSVSFPRGANPCQQYDRHQVQNRLGGLLVGLRAMGADLRSHSQDPSKINRILDDYLDSLCEAVTDVAHALPVCRKNHDKGQLQSS